MLLSVCKPCNMQDQRETMEETVTNTSDFDALYSTLGEVYDINIILLIILLLWQDLSITYIYDYVFP